MEPYEAPVISSRGWRVGPLLHQAVAAAGAGAGLSATVTVNATIAADLAVGDGAGLAAELLYTPVANIDALPAAADGAALAADVSLSIPVTMDLAAGAGDALVPTMSILSTISDDFNRANSSSGLGTDWTNRNGVMGIDTNTAIPVTAGVYNAATHNTLMGTDDVAVSVVLGSLAGSGNDGFYLILGSNSSGQGVWCDFNGTTIYIWSTTGWNFASGATVRGTNGSTAWAAGQTLTFRRVGNVYTVLQNGSAITGATWTDSGNVVARDSSHRIVGFGEYRNAGNYRRIDSFTALTP